MSAMNISHTGQLQSNAYINRNSCAIGLMLQCRLKSKKIAHLQQSKVSEVRATAGMYTSLQAGLGVTAAF